MSQNYANYGRPNRKTGPCDCCVRAVKWIPVLFIFSIICWSYYAFVVQLCFRKYGKIITWPSDAILRPFRPVLPILSHFFDQNPFSTSVTVENIAEKIILLLFYHIFCFLFLWSYYQTIFVNIALVPQEVSHINYRCINNW